VAHVLRYGEIYDDGQPLQRYASRSSWEQLLSANGLVVERAMGYDLEAPRTLPDLMWLLRRPWKILHLLIAMFLPVNLGAHLVFVCRKRP
jgi:hypothetical protein